MTHTTLQKGTGMRIYELRAALQNGPVPVGSGVTVTRIRKLDLDFARVTLSTGRTVRIHKRASVADLFVGHLPARSFRDGRLPEVRNVRAHSPHWRGEFAGRKGERLTAQYPVDTRAVMERDSARRRAAAQHG